MSTIQYKQFTAYGALERNLRAKHAFVFEGESARAPGLKLALPYLGWETLPSGKLSLPFGAGMRIALLASTCDESDAESLRVIVDKPKLESLAAGWEAIDNSLIPAAPSCFGKG